SRRVRVRGSSAAIEWPRRLQASHPPSFFTTGTQPTKYPRSGFREIRFAASAVRKMTKVPNAVMMRFSVQSLCNRFRRIRMKGFVDNIEKLTTENDLFRKVLYTGQYLQLVLMTLKPGEEIGAEVHEDHDQFFRVEEGSGEVIIDGQSRAIKDDDAVIVPAGARHNVVNNGDQPLKLYTIYGPPEHRDGVVHATKAQADASDEHFDGKTTE